MSAISAPTLCVRSFILIAAVVSSALHAQSRYRIIDTGLASPLEVEAQGMNDRGDIVGALYSANGDSRAFIYDYSSRSAADLGVVGNGTTFTASEARAVNDHGTIVGMSTVSGQEGWHGVLWNKSGGYELLDGIALVGAIDRKGRIVGQSDDYRGVMWVRGQVTDLGLPDEAIPHNLSDAGFIVGFLDDNHGFLYHDGETEELPLLYAQSWSDAVAVNNFGEAVGNAGIAPVIGDYGGYEYPQHAIFYAQGDMRDLGVLQSYDPGASSYARDINDAHQIVGLSQGKASPDGGPDQSIAFLYENGTLRNLNDLIDPADPLAGHVTLSSASAINCRGWIAAEGTNHTTGMTGAYLLIPGKTSGQHDACK